jgi:signal transduction histidine kinase
VQTDLATLVRRTVAAMQPPGEELAIAVDAPQTLPATVDPSGIEQVLTQLLDNAVRYSPDGGAISVSLTRDEENARAIVRVRDHGLGIPPEQRSRLFERFFQAHRNEFRSGMGLGLYLCRQIVLQHGGEIHADFPEDGGGCFTVELPLEPPAPPGADAGGAEKVAPHRSE